MQSKTTLLMPFYLSYNGKDKQKKWKTNAGYGLKLSLLVRLKTAAVNKQVTMENLQNSSQSYHSTVPYFVICQRSQHPTFHIIAQLCPLLLCTK